MKTFGLNRVISLLLLLLLSFSCASDLDYDQVNDIKLEPVFIANLASFDVLANEFVTGGVEQNVIFDAPTVDVFTDSFFRKSLKKVDFLLEMENTISRAYVIDLAFLDRNNQVVHVTNFTVPAYRGVKNKVTRTEIFENTQLDLLKRTVRIAFTLRMLPGTPLTESSPGNLKLRSGVTVYLVIE
jgi:hypothetical protein